jgi:flagellin
MGLQVNTNIDAIAVHNNLIRTNSTVTESLRRLSSGLRINSAKDDASGFAIANSFKAKVASMRVASQNAGEGQSMLQVADGAYNKINDILVRMKQLATQAASGQTESLTTMNNEFSALQKEIDRIANSTKYGGTNLINGAGSAGQSGGGPAPDFSTQISNYANDVLDLFNEGVNDAHGESVNATAAWADCYNADLRTLSASNALAASAFAQSRASAYSGSPYVSSLFQDMKAQADYILSNSLMPTPSATGATHITFQVGATNASTDQLVISFNSATSDSLGVSTSTIGISSLASAQAAMSEIDAALTSINSFMGDLGAYQNRLQYTIDNLSIGIQNFTSSASTIEDVDMASEVSELSKNQILQQTGMAMLAQANQTPQQILTLLR